MPAVIDNTKRGGSLDHCVRSWIMMVTTPTVTEAGLEPP